MFVSCWDDAIESENGKQMRGESLHADPDRVVDLIVGR